MVEQALDQFDVETHRGKKRQRADCRSCRSRAKRNYHLFRDYGITIEDEDRMLLEQGGVCKVCKRPEPIKGKRMAIDHCHTTGRVRGILCSNCNRALGLLRDSPTIIFNLYKYSLGE